MIRGDGGYLESETRRFIELTRKEKTRKIFRGFLKGLGEFLYILTIVIGFCIVIAFGIHPVAGLVVAGIVLIGPIYLMSVFLGFPVVLSIIIWTFVVFSSVVLFIVKKVRRSLDRRELDRLRQQKLNMIREEALRRNEETEREPMDFDGFMASWDYFDKEDRKRDLQSSKAVKPQLAQPTPETPEEYYMKRWGVDKF